MTDPMRAGLPAVGAAAAAVAADLTVADQNQDDSLPTVASALRTRMPTPVELVGTSISIAQPATPMVCRLVGPMRRLTPRAPERMRTEPDRLRLRSG